MYGMMQTMRMCDCEVVSLYCFVGIFITNYYTPRLHKGDAYSIKEILLPPIENQVFCKYYSMEKSEKIKYTFPVVQEVHKIKNYNELQWPGQKLEKGDVVGYMFKVGERSIEVLNIGNKTSEDIPNGACF